MDNFDKGNTVHEIIFGTVMVARFVFLVIVTLRKASSMIIDMRRAQTATEEEVEIGSNNPQQVFGLSSVWVAFIFAMTTTHTVVTYQGAISGNTLLLTISTLLAP